MSNFLDALGNAARSGACTVLGSSSYINDALQRIGFFPFDEARRAIPDFWRNALCDTPAPQPNPAPFTGGQCDAPYLVAVGIGFTQPDGTVVPPANPGVRIGPYQGPLGIAQRQNGTVTEFFNPTDGLTYGGVTTQGPGANTNPTIQLYDILRQGGPDNCGDPAPIYEPLEPGDVTVNQNITYDNSQGATITIPVVLVYARANIDARANITIPFTANINGELDVTGNLNLDGTVNFNIGGAGGTAAPKDPRKSPCDDIALPVETPPEDPTDSEQPPEPDRDEEEVIIGVLVTVTNLTNERASTIVQSDNPDIYVPSLGHVNFLCRVGQTSAGWTTDIQVKNRRHLIQCPWSLGAIAVRGTPQPGVSWELTPIYGYAGRPVEYVQ